MTTQSWSIIIFCYNEANTVPAVIDSAFRFLKTIECENSEVIVVDDGSTDGSHRRISESKAKYPGLVVLTHAKNKGIGTALRSGYFTAKHENVIAIPADAQFDINEAVPYAAVPGDSFVSFFRTENTIYSFKRNVLSFINKMINRVFLGISLKDVNWVKIYKRETILKNKLRLKSSLVESEICAKLLLTGNRVTEVNSVYHKRKYGESKGASFRIAGKAMMETLKLIIVILFFRIKKMIYGKN